jgi:enamine deaminase RidA (YjgF/YER057c/UK114 family)
MSRQSIQPDELFDSSPYGFSQVVACSGQRVVYCAGQTANDKDLNLLGAGDLKVQLEASLENVRIALAAAGAEPRDVVSIRTYIVDYMPEYLEIVSSVMNEFFADSLPASTLIGVKALALPHFMCEIEAIAVLE